MPPRERPITAQEYRRALKLVGDEFGNAVAPFDRLRPAPFSAQPASNSSTVKGSNHAGVRANLIELRIHTS
jgi:hypothetical protein